MGSRLHLSKEGTSISPRSSRSRLATTPFSVQAKVAERENPPSSSKEEDISQERSPATQSHARTTETPLYHFTQIPLYPPGVSPPPPPTPLTLQMKRLLSPLSIHDRVGEGIIQCKFGDDLSEKQKGDLATSETVATTLGSLFDTGFALFNKAGRVVYTKSGTFEDAKTAVTNFFALDYDAESG